MTNVVHGKIGFTVRANPHKYFFLFFDLDRLFRSPRSSTNQIDRSRITEIGI